eukprot:11862327-Ditylum_brightwellii.AAC.1
MISSTAYIDRHLPGITLATTITLPVMEKLCKGTRDKDGKIVEFLSLCKDSNFVSGDINLNAETGVPHTERDL